MIKHRLRIVACPGHDGAEEERIDEQRNTVRYSMLPQQVRLRLLGCVQTGELSMDPRLY